MKRFLVLIFAIFVFLTLPALVLAEENQTFPWGENDELLVVEEDEVVDRDFYGGAGRVEIYGTVNGDVYTAGGQVVVEGKVNGDVLAAGGMIDIGGVVSQDVRIIGGQLTVSGEVGKNVTFAGGNINLTDSARIGGSVLGGGGNVNIASPVAKNVTVGAGALVLSSQVGGDVEVRIENLRLAPGAEILGDLTYWSNNEAVVSDSSVVSGGILRKEPKANLQTDFDGETAAQGLEKAWGGVRAFFRVTSLVSSLIVGLLLIWLFPKFTQKASELIGEKPLSVFGLGLIGLIVVPVIMVALLITLIGFPLSLMLMIFYLMSIYLSKVFVSVFVGGMIFSWLKVKAKLGWVFIVGLMVYFLIRSVPLVGGLAIFFSLIFGLGAFWLTLREFWQIGNRKK